MLEPGRAGKLAGSPDDSAIAQGLQRLDVTEVDLVAARFGIRLRGSEMSSSSPDWRSRKSFAEALVLFLSLPRSTIQPLS